MFHADFWNCQISKLPEWKYGNVEIWKFKAVIFCPKKRVCKVSNSLSRQFATFGIVQILLRYICPLLSFIANCPPTGSKGQALRVFEKKSPHRRYASGSIFFQKTLTAAATLPMLKSGQAFPAAKNRRTPPPPPQITLWLSPQWASWKTDRTPIFRR